MLSVKARIAVLDLAVDYKPAKSSLTYWRNSRVKSSRKSGTLKREHTSNEHIGESKRSKKGRMGDA
jgi:hypothetical protein